MSTLPQSRVAAGVPAGGQFTTQGRAEAMVSLAPRPDALDAETMAAYANELVRRVEAARDTYFDYSCVGDLRETIGEAAEYDDFDPADAAYAFIDDDRDDDGDRCSHVVFYDTAGAELGRAMQAGYLTGRLPARFRAANIPSVLQGHGDTVDLAKVNAYDWNSPAHRYASEMWTAGQGYITELDRKRTEVTGVSYCPKCGSPTDAPDPTCPACPETERVACAAGNCTYIAADQDDLAHHASYECNYA